MAGTPRRVLLLRGVNVGGRNMLPMPRLRELAGGLGCSEPATYLQSGNLVVGSDRIGLAGALRAAIADQAGLDVPVLERSHAELLSVIAANPLGAPADTARFFVGFCEHPVGGALDDLDPTPHLPATFDAVDREIYSWVPGGMNGSRLTGALWERRTGGVVTVRNWRTVLALVELSRPRPAPG